MWKRGIWIARALGITLIILGVASSLGLITIYVSMTGMNQNMQTNGEDSMVMPQDNSKNKNNNTADLSDKNNSPISNATTMLPGMRM
jgi:hypothetical protein